MKSLGFVRALNKTPRKGNSQTRKFIRSFSQIRQSVPAQRRITRRVVYRPMMQEPRQQFEAHRQNSGMRNFFEHYDDDFLSDPDGTKLRLLDLRKSKSEGSTGSMFGI